MPTGTTFAQAGSEALQTLLRVYYSGNGLWNQCNSPNCAQANSDWGADSLTYALYLSSATKPDSSIPPVMSALTATAPNYPGPCTIPSCGSWSDVPQWDTIADIREYEVTRDPQALAKAEAAFEFAEGSNAYALGACPDIRYQQPSGQLNHLKTLETDANAIKAAILLYQTTGDGPTSSPRRCATPPSARISSTRPFRSTASTSSTTARRAARCPTASSPRSTAT